jgi:hypothetical protein
MYFRCEDYLRLLQNGAAGMPMNGRVPGAIVSRLRAGAFGAFALVSSDERESGLPKDKQK